eukprot:s1106_g15.t1
MEEKALWQYARFVYANQVDTFTFDPVLSGIVERIEEQWQISLSTDDLEVRYDENNGLEVFQVTRDQPFWNLRNLLDQTVLRGRRTNSLDTCDHHCDATLLYVYRFKMSGIKRDAAMAHLTWPTDSRPPASGSASSQSVLPLVLPSSGPNDTSEMDYNTTYGATSTAPAAPFIPDNTDDDRAPIPAGPAGMKRLPKHQLTFTVCEWNGGTHSDLQVAEHNLETKSFREHQVEFFFYKLVGDWHTAQKMGNYWRQHYGLDTLLMDPVSAPDLPTGVLPDVTTLDPATVYAAQLMTVFRSLPSAASPEQQRSQLVTLVQDSEVRNMFTPIDLNTLATQIHQLADLLSEANALPMEVHLTPTDASLL